MKMWLLWIFFLSSFNSFCMDDSCFYFVTPRLCKSIVINLLGFLLLLSGWLFCHAACRILVLYQGSNLCPLQWSASLTTGLPGKSLACLLTKQKPCLEEVKKQQQQPKPLCFVILTIFIDFNNELVASQLLSELAFGAHSGVSAMSTSNLGFLFF